MADACAKRLIPHRQPHRNKIAETTRATGVHSRTMNPSAGYDWEPVSEEYKSRRHRYFTRSSRNHEGEVAEGRRQSDGHAHAHATQSPPRRSVDLSRRTPLPPSHSPSQVEFDGEAQEPDPSQADMVVDQITQPISAPVRAPFPSPAIKHVQPFHQFQQGCQFSHSDGGWEHVDPSWSSGTCILLEAANRAQMAILVDDMRGMGLDQMEQT